MLTTLSLIASFASFPLLSPAQQTVRILAPDAIVATDGQLLEGYKVVVAGGKIIEVAVSPKAIGIETKLDGVLAQGFFDTFAQLGADIFLTEQSDKVTPDLLVADGARLGSEAWQELAKHGVTSAHLIPDPYARGYKSQD